MRIDILRRKNIIRRINVLSPSLSLKLNSTLLHLASYHDVRVEMSGSDEDDNYVEIKNFLN